MVNGTRIPSLMVARHPSGCSFQLLWLKENDKGNEKGFGKAK